MRRLILLITVLVMLVSMVAVAAQPPGYIFHVVQPGENLFRISLRYNVTMASIIAANGIFNPNRIFAGQTLLIPIGHTPTPPSPPPISGFYYTVRPGDTLGTIARQFNTTVAAIASANGITNVNRIFAGQVLLIPPAPPPPTRITPYVVQPGDTLSRIAVRFNTTVAAIATYNRLANPSRIFPGQLLYIPH